MRKSSLLCGTGGMGKEVRPHVEDGVFLQQNVLDKANAICEVCLGLYLYFIYSDKHGNQRPLREERVYFIRCFQVKIHH